MKRIYLYILSFSLILTLTGSQFAYGFSSDSVMEEERELEKEIDEIEAIHASSLELTKRVHVIIESGYSEYSKVDYIFYSESFTSNSLLKRYIMFQSLVHYS